MRRLLLVLVVLASWVAVAATPAAAVPPTRYSFDDHPRYQPFDFGEGSCAFGVLFSADAHFQATDFYDSSGNLTLTTWHFTFTGTLYNETDTSKSIPYWGHAYWTLDAQSVSDMATYEYLASVDGHNVPVIVGLQKVTYNPLEIVNHLNGFVPEICAALT